MNNFNNNNQRQGQPPRQLIPRSATSNLKVVGAAQNGGPTVLGGQPPQYPYHHQMAMSNNINYDQDKRLFDAWSTKIARSRRKMARQIRAHLKSNSNNVHRSNSSSSSPPSSSCSSSWNSSTVLSSEEEEEALPNNIPLHTQEHLYCFFTPDNKRLRMLLKKELKNSDVGSLGRIVLPKREAEDNLPSLYDKEGIQVMIKEIYSDKQWGLRYKYWINNKSRMYVLENTGDFVKQNGLAMGDSITLYEDQSKNLYVAMNKVRPATKSETSCNLLHHNNQAFTNDMLQCNDLTTINDEGATSLAFLIEQLEHKDQAEAANNNSFLSTSSPPNSYIERAFEEEGKCNTPFSGHFNADGESLMDFDDCYGELGLLPEVDQYDYYGYATMFDPIW